MKKVLLPLVILFFALGYSQSGRVGINNTAPNSTLDVTAKLGATDIDGMQAPRLTLAQLTMKGDALYGVSQSGTLIYITDVAGGDNTGQRANITAAGYYYFDGTIWNVVAGVVGTGTTNADVGGDGEYPGMFVATGGVNYKIPITYNVNGGGNSAQWDDIDNAFVVPVTGDYLISILVQFNSSLWVVSGLYAGFGVNNSSTMTDFANAYAPAYTLGSLTIDCRGVYRRKLNAGDRIYLQGGSSETCNISRGRLTITKI